jgi:cyanophycinase-like exopeptidase
LRTSPFTGHPVHAKWRHGKVERGYMLEMIQQQSREHTMTGANLQNRRQVLGHNSHQIVDTRLFFIRQLCH